MLSDPLWSPPRYPTRVHINVADTTYLPVLPESGCLLRIVKSEHVGRPQVDDVPCGQDTSNKKVYYKW